MLHFHVITGKAQVFFRHEKGPIEVGRGSPRGDCARIRLNDTLISRDHVRLDELDGGKVRIRNLSQRLTIQLPGSSPLAPGASCERALPLRLILGEAVVGVSFRADGTELPADRDNEAEGVVRAPTVFEPLEAAPREPTLLEPVGGAARQAAAEASPPIPRRDEPRQPSDTQLFRPTRRPPTARLCVLHDGEADAGEWVRVQLAEFVIGRLEGDLLVPHDLGISRRHAMLIRRAEKVGYSWWLRDLDSRNGSFVRRREAVLVSGQELLIGRHCYRFELGNRTAPPGGPEGPENAAEHTINLKRLDLPAALVQVSDEEEPWRFVLPESDNWVGRSAAHCSVVLDNDDLVSARHARLYRTGDGHWKVEDSVPSRNGTWVRITEHLVEGECEFQLGEQRFLVQV